MPTLTGATLMYTKIQTPGTKYQSDEKEYVVDAYVSKDTAKSWNKSYPKSKAKEIENDEFVEKFEGVKLPYPDQDSQYMIKIKRGAAYKDGNEIPLAKRPKVFMKNEHGKLEDVTATKLVGNGSKGVVQYEEFENSFGKFVNLVAVRVDELVAYNKGGIDYSELGEMDDSAPAFEDEVPKAKQAPKKAAVEDLEDEDSSQLPF